jgi:Transcriptional regulator PadR-like family
MGLTNTPSDLLPGTLELLILKAISHGALHGYGIVEHLRLTSADVLQVGESALYPALQRLTARSPGPTCASTWPRQARRHFSTAPT